jgi:hypothetical protein
LSDLSSRWYFSQTSHWRTRRIIDTTTTIIITITLGLTAESAGGHARRSRHRSFLAIGRAGTSR